MTIKNLELDFSQYENKSLINQGKARILFEYAKSPIFVKIVKAYMEEIQELYDAIIQLQKRSFIFYGEGQDLDLIGEILGQKRTYFNYDTSFWFAPDDAETTVDKGSAWVKNAEQAVIENMSDDMYRKYLWGKALKNHVKFASREELQRIIFEIMEIYVSFSDADKCDVDLIVPASISKTNKNYLTYFADNNQVDQKANIPYPATMNIRNVIERKG